MVLNANKDMVSSFMVDINPFMEIDQITCGCFVVLGTCGFYVKYKRFMSKSCTRIEIMKRKDTH